MAKRALRIVFRKARREIGTSLLTIGVIALTLGGFMTLASTGSSLQSGLENYVNALAPWVVIEPNGLCPIQSECRSTLPLSTVSNISSIPHVQKVYRVLLFTTNWPLHNYSVVFNGKSLNMNGTEGFRSALVGGPSSFPAFLLEVKNGSFPQGSEPAFVIYENLPPFIFGKNYTVYLSLLDKIEPISNLFNATHIGVLATNPLFSYVGVFWNSTFVMQELGPTLYNQTFYGEPNYIIVKVDNVNDVASVVDRLNAIIQPYPKFVTEYNGVLIDSLRSFQSQTAPLYYALDVAALIGAIGVTTMLASISARRRIWEAGLFVSQGWRWSSVFRLYYLYFLLLSSIGFAIAVVGSIVVSNFLAFSYVVFVSIFTIKVSISPIFVLTSIVLVIFIPYVASYIVQRRFRKGLDRLLAEY